MLTQAEPYQRLEGVAANRAQQGAQVACRRLHVHRFRHAGPRDLFGVRDIEQHVSSDPCELEVLEPLIGAGAVEFAGERFQVKGAIGFENRTACPIMLAALGPRMLELAGRQTAGTIIWAAGLKALRDYVVPRINEAATAVDRPAPRIVAGLAIAVVSDVSEARAAADRVFARYLRAPAYRAMLDRERASGFGEVAVVGDADGVADQLQRIAEVGVTDVWAIPFPVEAEGPDVMERTRELLAQLARSKFAAG